MHSDVRPSVRLSVARVYYVERTELTIKQLGLELDYTAGSAGIGIVNTPCGKHYLIYLWMFDKQLGVQWRPSRHSELEND